MRRSRDFPLAAPFCPLLFPATLLGPLPPALPARSAVHPPARDSPGRIPGPASRRVHEHAVGQRMARKHRQVPLRRESLRAPEAHEPERHRCRHDGQRRCVHRHPQRQVERRRRRHGGREPPGGARERSRRRACRRPSPCTPRCPCGPPRSASGRPYAGSQLVSSMPK